MSFCPLKDSVGLVKESSWKWFPQLGIWPQTKGCVTPYCTFRHLSINASVFAGIVLELSLMAIIFHVLFPILLVKLSVFDSLCILKFNHKHAKLPFLGKGDDFVDFTDGLDAIKINQPLITAGYLWHVFGNFYMYLYEDMRVEGTAKRNCLVMKMCPLGFALKMAVLSKVSWFKFLLLWTFLRQRSRELCSGSVASVVKAVPKWIFVICSLG